MYRIFSINSPRLLFLYSYLADEAYKRDQASNRDRLIIIKFNKSILLMTISHFLLKPSFCLHHSLILLGSTLNSLAAKKESK